MEAENRLLSGAFLFGTLVITLLMRWLNQESWRKSVAFGVVVSGVLVGAVIGITMPHLGASGLVNGVLILYWAGVSLLGTVVLRVETGNALSRCFLLATFVGAAPLAVVWGGMLMAAGV